MFTASIACCCHIGHKLGNCNCLSMAVGNRAYAPYGGCIQFHSLHHPIAQKTSVYPPPNNVSPILHRHHETRNSTNTSNGYLPEPWYSQSLSSRDSFALERGAFGKMLVPCECCFVEHNTNTRLHASLATWLSYFREELISFWLTGIYCE